MDIIREAQIHEIEPFKKACIREKLTFNNKTQYFAYIREGKIIGFTGIMFYKNKVVFKNSYVLPEYRRQGIYTALNEYRMNLVKQLRKPIEINCTDKSLPLHLKNGARVVKRYKICTKVVYENKQ